MQGVLIIRRQIEAIRHREKPASILVEEWKSIDEIARSTIGCIWLKMSSISVWQRRRQHSLCVKSYRSFTKNSPHRNSY